MEISQSDTLVAVFDNRTQAEKAIDELRRAGFRNDQIGIAVRSGDVTAPPPADEEEPAPDRAVTGALTGGAFGALAGALATGLIPGVGWVVAGGILAGIVGGAAAGAAAAGLLDTLLGMGLSEDEARFYESQLAKGHTIVTVKSDGRLVEAGSILKRHEAFDAHTPGHSSATYVV